MSLCVNWPFFLTSGPLLNASETSAKKGLIYTRSIQRFFVRRAP
ncbi:unnamed protein product [Tenebrio molitor]|nr:unnamed protein product [Tenebrio molitor]